MLRVMAWIARLLPCALVLVALGVPASAHAATCADYPDQASAQRAHDTVDADGDGIYCESLSCPCLKPGAPAPTPAPTAAPTVTPAPTATPAPEATGEATCTRPS